MLCCRKKEEKEKHKINRIALAIAAVSFAFIAMFVGLKFDKGDFFCLNTLIPKISEAFMKFGRKINMESFVKLAQFGNFCIVICSFIFLPSLLAGIRSVYRNKIFSNDQPGNLPDVNENENVELTTIEPQQPNLYQW
jgi:hypothetical protein